MSNKLYMIKWIDNGIEKSDVCHGWIERDCLIEVLTEQGFNPTYEIL